MNNNNGAISFKALLETRDFEQGRFKIESQLRDLTKLADQEAAKFDHAFKRAGQAMAAYFTFDAAKQLVGDIVKVRGEFQQLEIAFTTMLGSKAKADELMARSVTFAAQTHYGLEATASATKQLLAYGESAETVTDTLRKLGDIASGLNIPLSDIAYLYGTTMTQGRLYTQDFNQFVGRGIPLIKELSSQFGVAESEVKGLVEAGKVGFPEIKKAIDNMTTAGSMFGGLMEAQSKSIPGQIEQLKDAWAQMLNSIGKDNEGVINSSIASLATLIEHYDDVGRVLAGIVATYGTYKAALILTSVAERTIASSKVASVYLEMTAGLGKVTFAHRARAVALGVETAAQRALNATMLANPYVAVTAAVVGLGVAIWALHDDTTSFEKAQAALNEKLEEARQKKDNLSNSASSLISVIKDETKSIYDQIVAYEELINKIPELQKFSRVDIQTMDGTELTKIVNKALSDLDIKNQAKDLEYFKKMLDEVRSEMENRTDYKASDEIKKSVKELDNWKTSYEDIIAYLEQSITHLEKQKGIQEEAARLEEIKTWPIKEQITYHQQNLEKLENQKRQLQTGLLLANQTGQSFSTWQQKLDSISLQSVLNQIQQVNGELGRLGVGVDPTNKNKAYYEGVKQKAQESLAGLDIAQKGTAEWNKYVVEIQEADKALESYNTTIKKSGSGSKKKADEKFLEGSIKWFDQQIQKLQEKLERLPVNEANTSAIQELQNKILSLTKARAEAQKAIEVRTWQETIDEKRKLYDEFEALLANADLTTGANAIDVMALENAKSAYSELLKGGQNYKEFLESELAPLTQKVMGSEATQEELSKFLFLTKELNTVMGKSSPMERFNLMLESISEGAGNSTEAIKDLESVVANLNLTPEGDRGTLWYEQFKEVESRLKEARKNAANELKQWLSQLEGSKQKELAIIKKYEGLIKQAELEGQNTEPIHRAYNEEMAQVYAEGLEAYRVMNELMGAEDLKRLKEQEEAIKQLIQNLIDAGYGGSEVVKKLQENQIENTNRQADRTYQNLMLWQQAIGQAGSELSQLEGTLGNIGQLFSSAAQSAQQFASTYANMTDGNKSNDGQGYAAAAQAGVNLIALVIGAAQKRKAKRKQEAANTLQVQLDLNKALVEEIRLRTELSENVYVTNYYDRIRDSIDGMAMASQNAFKSLLALSIAGQAKNGTKNKIDWGAVGAGAGAGATIGVAIGGTGGTVLPVIGNVVLGVVGGVIGAIAGGLVGMFGAMKKDSRYSGIFEVYPELIDQSGQLNRSLAETLIANDQLTTSAKQYLQSLIDADDAFKSFREKIKEVVGELTGQMGNQLRDALVGAFEEGKDAALDFANVVEDTLQNALEQLIYSKVFSNLFDTLGTDMENALLFYGATGDLAGVYDAMGKFMANSQESIDIFNKVMEAAQEYGKNYGFELWDNVDSRAEGMAGQIKGVTEETANVLAGNITQMRIRQAEHSELFRQQLFHLANIDRNTFAISEYTARLERIDRNLERMANGSSARDFGGQY